MFESKTMFEIIAMGGETMYVLIACGILSVAIILERSFRYWKYALDCDLFMNDIKAAMQKGAYEAAMSICRIKNTPATLVVWAGLEKASLSERIVQETMEREILKETVELERYTAVVGTIGKVAVYIGLFGTVLGIINAFHNISAMESGGFSIIIGGVSEALVCTATGLLIAVPSVVAHSLFMRRVDALVVDMQYCASMTMEYLSIFPAKKNEP